MRSIWKKEGTPVGDRALRVQRWCLLAVIAVELVFFLLEDRAGGLAYLFMERYLTLPAMAFAGASLCREQTGKRQLLAGLAVVGLFFLTQTLHRVLEADAKEVGTFVCAYVLCFPFAAATGDAQRQWGLKRMAGLFVAVGALIALYAAALLCGAVPGFLKDYVNWDGVRFSAMGHANICATLLMISTALSVGFAFKTRRGWVRALLLTLAVLEFSALALTNGRTTIILTCGLLGGLTFCALRKTGWKRFVAALLAAVLVMGGLFGASRSLYKWNQARLLAQWQQPSAPAAEEQTETAQSEVGNEQETLTAESEVRNKQGTLTEDFRSLNGRTVIWSNALQQLKENPRIVLIGTEYVEMYMSRNNPLPVRHAHNSWLEALFRMGLPGLTAALVITALAVWNAAVLLWRNRDLWESCIALLMLCLLGCAALEPYLFVVDVSYHYLDFLFLMCLGYTSLWRARSVE